MGTVNYKTSYYNILEKELKNSYDKIQNNKFNKEYSLKMNQFISSRKSRVINIIEGNIDWKSYLLNKLDSSNDSSWEFSLSNYIYSEFNKKRLEEKYKYENEIFYNQFFLRNNPQLALKDSENLHEPVLYLLYDMEELDKYSEKSKKTFKKKKKNKEKNDDHNISKSSNGIELPQIKEPKIDEESNNINNDINNISDTNNDIKINEEDDYFNKRGRKLTATKIVESESLFLKKDMSEGKNTNKYYSYQIRKHINLIRSQLEGKKEDKNNRIHPIYNIINKFSEIYSDKINYFSKSAGDDEKIIENSKNKIINDIQNFIDIIAIALKLFYMKSINYDYFVCERDEFINLICYFLFNEQKFEQSLFDFFELSNRKKQREFNNKKETILKDITPGEIGISEKFRLNEDTERLKEKLRNKIDIEIEYEEESKVNKTKTGLVKYIKHLDNEIEQERNLSAVERVNNLEMVSSFNSRRKMSLFTPDDDRSIGSIISNNDNNIIYAQNKENNQINRDLISNYDDFSKKFNSSNISLKDQYQEDADNNPSEINFPKSEKSKYDPSKPYQEAIDYIETIRDYKAPLDQLTIIALVSPLITDNINNCWKDVKGLKKNFLCVDSDELLSIYLYIICKMKTDSIFTHLDLIKHFTGTNSKQSMIGYFYTTVDGCVKYILNIKSKDDLKQNEI